MVHVLAVVLARGGSKGIPHKNIVELCGKPVLCWTLDEAEKSKLIDDIILSSDDPAILQVGREAGVITLYRPPELAQDTTPTLPALQHAVLTHENLVNFQYDYIVELRATSPLKTVEDIDGAIQLLIDSGADSVIGVTECQEYHPARVKYLSDGYIQSFFPEPPNGRRQELVPLAYVRNGTIYAFRREALFGLDAKLFGHTKSLAYTMPAERSVNLESPIDLILAEALLLKRTSNT